MDPASILNFVNKRARADFVGYVDVVTLAPVATPVIRGIRVFNTLVNVPVPQFRRTLQEELSKQLERLSLDSREQWTTRQLLLTDVLPRLGYEKDLCAIAAALPASLPAVRQDAAARLEGLLLLFDYREKAKVKTLLLSVAQMTKSILLQPTNDEHDMRVYVNLHMMCTSALLTKSDSPASGSECKTFMLTPKEIKKQAGSRQEMLKAVLSFYNHFDSCKRGLSLTTLERTKRPQEFSRKHFCEQMSYIFQLLNEVSQEGWSQQSWELLKELHELYQALPTAGKYHLSPENNAVLDFMILRGLVILLNTTFAAAKVEAGSVLYDHAKLAAEITVEVATKCLARPSGSVDVSAGDLGSLLFHESHCVRKAISSADILSLSSLLLFYNKYLNDNLRIADLHISDLATTQENDKDQGEGTGQTCGWHRFKGRMGAGSVEGSVLVHTKDCLVEDSTTCLKKRRLGGQIRHLEMLLQLSPSTHIIQMLAYQVNPFPFYVTEQVKGQRLLDHLLSHRTGQRWLDTPTLCRVSLDIVSALEFLDSKNIASRDITAYDLVVAGRRRRGGKAGELIEVLASDEFTIRLANLSLAHQYRSAHNSEAIITVAEQGPVPVLWTAPEGLVKGEYSCKSMVYSLGCVMYELWTHGFEPFSSYQKTTVETLTQMLTVEDSVTLVHWPCIPQNVYEVIRKCTSFNPSSRPLLTDIKNVLTELISNSGKATRRLSVTTEEDYPRFYSDQRRRQHVPERGIPKDLQPVLDRLKAKGFDSPSTARASEWCIDDDRVIKVNESELMTRESCKIIHKENETSVRENLSQMFVKDVLMSLLECCPPKGLPLPGVTDCTHAATFGKDNTPGDYLLDERVYPRSWTLKEAAAKGLLIEDSNYVPMGPQGVFDVFAAIAKTVHVLHERHWLLRDLRASYILLTRDKYKVSFCRIGRMLHLPSSEMSFVQEPFEDSKRWLAPEVLTSGKYTTANDIFMLGTVFWETFRAREVARKHPSAFDLQSVPFASCEQEKASSLVKAGTPLPQPTHCPDWLYDVILQCRICEPSERPSALQVLQTLEKFMKKEELERRSLPSARKVQDTGNAPSANHHLSLTLPFDSNEIGNDDDMCSPGHVSKRKEIGRKHYQPVNVLPTLMKPVSRHDKKSIFSEQATRMEEGESADTARSRLNRNKSRSEPHLLEDREDEDNHLYDVLF